MFFFEPAVRFYWVKEEPSWAMKSCTCLKGEATFFLACTFFLA
jgi:hypothetical protein